MRVSKERVRFVGTILFTLACVSAALLLPGLPSGQASVSNTAAKSATAIKSSASTQKPSDSGLDAERRAALEQLLAQLKSGGAFSEEETIILRRYASGEALTNLEADVVISRALYDRFIANKELSRQQEVLFDQYSLFTS